MTKEDWRETLFVWDGILSFIEGEEKGKEEEGSGNEADDKTDADDGVRVRWRGTWIGCESADASKVRTPIRGAFDEFVSSDHAFEVEGAVSRVDDDAGDTKGGAGGDVYFFSPSLRWSGNLRNQVPNVVLAVGRNEYGNFISVGWLRVGNRVTLARRYVDNDDERSGWDVDDLRRAVFGEIAATSAVDGHVEIVIPPWQCAAMHADAAVGSKRQKIASKSDV